MPSSPSFVIWLIVGIDVSLGIETRLIDEYPLSLRPNMKKYVFAVLSDRIQAEEASTALENAGVPSAAISVLGKGYKSADEYGLIDPKDPAQRQMSFLSYWLIPFGFVAGFSFSWLSGLETFAWAGEIGNHVIGGVLGAASGALGSFLVGGGVGLALGAGDALTYRNRLDAGKYVVIIEGSEALTRVATQILRQFEPESLQGYSEPPES